MSGQARKRKKGGPPSTNAGENAMIQDMSEAVPKIDDVLGDIDNALNVARKVQRRLDPPRELGSCGC